MTGTAPAAALADYRNAVEDIVHSYESAASECGPLAAGERRALHALLKLPYDQVDDVAEHIDHELRSFRPNSRSNAASPAALLRILLLQQIDVLWWAATTPFTDDSAVRSSPDLVSLPALRREGRLGFQFKIAPTTLPGRARNYAVRRWAAGYEPRSSGLSYGLARPAMIGLLNDVAQQLAEAVPHWRRRMWVNCIVRSVAGQQRLQQLGYSALLPSSHCVGFAADIEMAWARDQGIGEPLEEILLRHRDAGVLNVIDEGQAWHVCLNPDHAERYERTIAPIAGRGHR